MELEPERNSVHSFLEKVDIFGIAISIRFNLFKSHKTTFGGIITLTILGIILSQAVSVLSNSLKQNNPTVLSQIQYVYQPEILNITSTSFNIAIGIQDYNQHHFKDERIFKMKAIQKISNKILNQTTGEYELHWDYQELVLEQCTESHFEVQDTKEYFSKLSMSNLYCLSSTKNNNSMIEGQPSADRYQTVQFQILLCSNETQSTFTPFPSPLACASEEEINSKMKSIKLVAYFSDAFIEISNKNKPYYNVGQSLFWTSSIELTKEIYMYMQNNYIDTDLGFITQEIHKKRIVNYKNTREEANLRHSNEIFNFYLAYENCSQNYFSRSYSKLDEAFAQIGGFFNILVSLGCLLCWPISQLELNRKLINKAFDLHIDNKNNQENRCFNRDILKIKEEDLIMSKVEQVAGDGVLKIQKQQGQQNKILKNLIPSLKNISLKFFQSNNTQQDEALQTKLQISQTQLNMNTSHFETHKSKHFNLLSRTKSMGSKDQSPMNCKAPPLIPSKYQISHEPKKSLKDNMSFQSQVQEIQENQRDQEDKTCCKNSDENSSPNTNNNIKQLKKWKWLSFFDCKKKKKANEEVCDNIFLKRKRINISFLDYLKNYLAVFEFCESRKSKLIRQSTDLLYNHIDIFNIINKLGEIDKLKTLLLNEHQMRLFDFLPKPILSDQPHNNNINLSLPLDYNQSPCNFKKSVKIEGGNEFQPRHSLQSDIPKHNNSRRKTVIEKAQEAQESFYILKNKQQNMSEMDSKIIQMLDIPYEREFDTNQYGDLKGSLCESENHLQFMGLQQKTSILKENILSDENSKIEKWQIKEEKKYEMPHIEESSSNQSFQNIKNIYHNKQLSFYNLHQRDSDLKNQTESNQTSSLHQEEIIKYPPFQDYQQNSINLFKESSFHFEAPEMLTENRSESKIEQNLKCYNLQSFIKSSDGIKKKE